MLSCESRIVRKTTNHCQAVLKKIVGRNGLLTYLEGLKDQVRGGYCNHCTGVMIMARRAARFAVFITLCTAVFNGPRNLVTGLEEEALYYDDAYYDEESSSPPPPPALKIDDEEANSAALLAEELRLREEALEYARMQLLREQERKEKELLEEQARILAANNAKSTYKKSVGGGLSRVAVHLANDRFVNVTAAQYGCVLQSQLGIKQHNKNATKVQRTMQENARRQQDEFGKVVHPSKQQQMVEAAIGADGSTAVSSSTGAKTHTGGNAKEKKLTYRELQEQKREKRYLAEQEKEALKGKFLLGASCETLICGACKAMVEEFAASVVEGLRDPQYVYIEDLMNEFCRRKEIAMKYSDLVGSICFTVQNDKGGYREAFLQPFEKDGPEDWPKARTDVARLNAKKKEICTSIGACVPQQFELQLKPAKLEQQHWDDRCYVCQAFARDLEERVQLSKGITESNIVGIVVDTCNRLGLLSSGSGSATPALAELCTPLAQGKLLDDIAWIAKVHSEALLRQVRGELLFADRLCEEMHYCEKYVDPEELKRIEENKMEQVFF